MRYNVSTRAMRLLRATAASVVCATVMAGCAAGIKGRADPPEHLTASSNPSVYIDRLNRAVETARTAEAAYCSVRITSCPADYLTGKYNGFVGIGSDLKVYRDDYVYSMMDAYSLALQDYARALSVEGRSVSFGSHLVSLGLAAANTISPGETLGAITTAALGVEKGYDAELLLGKAIPALIKQMEAAQSRIRSSIFLRMKEDVDKYPLTAARADISSLGAAATIETAIAAISDQAESDKEKAEGKEEVSRGAPAVTGIADRENAEDIERVMEAENPGREADILETGDGFSVILNPE